MIGALTSCSLGTSENTIRVGYQSKTVNTVTAGALLKYFGFFETKLSQSRSTRHYNVEWYDFDTGAPITTNMIAGKLDIGSMGDFPLVLNASRTYSLGKLRTSLIGVTSLSPSGALNSIVTRNNSSFVSPTDLNNASISCSLGSAGDGLLTRVIDQYDLRDHSIVRHNQEPQFGLAMLKNGEVDAMSQFSPWPALAAFEDGCDVLIDGAVTNTPTFHGIVATANGSILSGLQYRRLSIRSMNVLNMSQISRFPQLR